MVQDVIKKEFLVFSFFLLVLTLTKIVIPLGIIAYLLVEVGTAVPGIKAGFLVCGVFSISNVCK